MNINIVMKQPKQYKPLPTRGISNAGLFVSGTIKQINKLCLS